MAKYFFNKEFLLTVNLLQSFEINVCLLAIVLETSKSKIERMKSTSALVPRK